MLKDDLIDLGLSETEADVYLAALELGPASIMQLAQKTQINRTSLYHIMEGLMRKKLFAEALHGKRKLFVAEDPQALKQLVARKMEKVEGMLGDLQALVRSGTAKPIIKLYDGLEGIKGVFREAARAKEKVLYGIVGIDRLNMSSKALLNFWNGEFVQLRKKHGTKGKLVVPDTDQGRAYKAADKESDRETRLVPASSYNFDCELLTYDDVVDILVFSEKEQFAVSIKSTAITNTIKMVWKIVWNQGY